MDIEAHLKVCFFLVFFRKQGTNVHRNVGRKKSAIQNNRQQCGQNRIMTIRITSRQTRPLLIS